MPAAMCVAMFLLASTVFSAYLTAQVGATVSCPYRGDVKFDDVDVEAHSDICYVLETFATDLQTPVSFRFPPGDTKRVFIAEQRGAVWVYDRWTGRRLPPEPPFLNLSHVIAYGGGGRGDERGLLQVAFHPRFNAGKPYLYAFYVTHEQNGAEKVRVSEFLTERDWRSHYTLVQSSERILLEIPQPHPNNNGGEMLFGTDNFLYIFLGDGGSTDGEVNNFAQNRSSLLGKVLRIDVDRATADKPYSIPTDNPFLDDSESRDEIYASGFRSNWRCDLDALTGRLFCGDVGHTAWEEINVVVKGGNYGWSVKEGSQCMHKDCLRLENEHVPIYQYAYDVGGRAVIGGVLYRGKSIPQLYGQFVYGDHVTGQFFTLTDISSANSASGSVWTNKELKPCYHKHVPRHILSFGKDPDGEIYVLKTSTKGMHSGIYRLKVNLKKTTPYNGCLVNFEVPDAGHALHKQATSTIMFLTIMSTCALYIINF